MLRIAAVSDIHGNLPKIPNCDILLIAGDIGPFGNEIVQLGFLNGPFRDWLVDLNGRGIQIVACAGNHDTIFEKNYNLVPQLPWIYLQDNETILYGNKIYGTPWVNKYYNWSFMTDELTLRQKFAMIPDDTDIIVTHGPPYGYGDKVEKSEGSISLLERIKEIQPKLVVYGHIHEGRGIYQIGKTTVANVTHVDDCMRAIYGAIIFDID